MNNRLPFHRQLRWRLTAIFLLVALAPILLITTLVVRQIESQTTTLVFDQLESVSTLKTRLIDEWLTIGQQTLNAVVVVPQVDSYLSIPSLRMEFSETLAQLAEESTSVEDIFIYDVEGTIIVSSSDIFLGRVVRRQPYFAASLEGEHLQPPYFDVSADGLVLVATKPIFDAEKLIGIAAIRYDTEQLSQFMLERSGLGETGETYLVSLENNYLLTPSRFEGYPQNRAYRSEGITAALNEVNGQGIYGDYRNPPVTVIGDYRWIPALQVGLLTEIDRGEAFSTLTQTQQLIVALALAVAVVVAGTGIYTTNRLARPIEEISLAATQVREGDLKQRVSVERSDELGLLANSFNDMVVGIENRAVEVRDARDKALALQRTAEEAQEVAQLGTWEWNVQTNELYWSEQSFRIWGLETSVEPSYELFMQAVHPDQRDQIQSLIQHTLQTGEPYEAEIRFVRPDGEVRYVIARGRLEYDQQQQPLKLLGTSLDITARKQAELEREKLIKDLQAARRIAEENSRLKSEFLSMMSHELRTPMNAIEGFTSIMLNGLGGVEFNEQADNFIRRIQSNSKRLLALINDFLDLSRIESGRMELAHTAFSPRELASKWQAEIGVLAEKKELAFETQVNSAVPETVIGDAEAVSKVAINLLSNAIKFTEKGTITLSLESQHENWCIIVADTGIGIPPHAREFIFDEFRQVDQSSKRKYGGTGLGLAITQKIVRYMGGSISLESEPGQGSTFTVTLPITA